MKRFLSILLAALLCLGLFSGIAPRAAAAEQEQADTLVTVTVETTDDEGLPTGDELFEEYLRQMILLTLAHATADYGFYVQHFLEQENDWAFPSNPEEDGGGTADGGTGATVKVSALSYVRSMMNEVNRYTDADWPHAASRSAWKNAAAAIYAYNRAANAAAALQ